MSAYLRFLVTMTTTTALLIMMFFSQWYMRLNYTVKLSSCDKYPACCEDWNDNKWHMCSYINKHWSFSVNETGTLSFEFVVTSNQKVIEYFHSRGQHLCRFTPVGTIESVYIWKEFNSHRTGLGHKHGRRFIVLGHKYGRHDVMLAYDSS